MCFHKSSITGKQQKHFDPDHGCSQHFPLSLRYQDFYIHTFEDAAVTFLYLEKYYFMDYCTFQQFIVSLDMSQYILSLEYKGWIGV